jgi:CRP/FNR family transcriptional regulator, anaerobic regulatory protein
VKNQILFKLEQVKPKQEMSMNSTPICQASHPNRAKSGSAGLLQLIGSRCFDNLQNAERERLESVHWAIKTIEGGRTVFDQGEARETVYVLLSGWAFRYQLLSDGKRQILDFVFGGSLLGFGSGGLNCYGLETVTDCRVAMLPYVQFRRLLALSPTLAISVAERISDSETRAHKHMTSLGLRGARERIAGLILELASRTLCNGLAGRSCKLALPITQIMIGDALGLSNEHVCRVLGKLANSGVISFSRNILEVLDKEALMLEAGLEMDDSSFGAGIGFAVAA